MVQHPFAASCFIAGAVSSSGKLSAAAFVACWRVDLTCIISCASPACDCSRYWLAIAVHPAAV
jgi:hypothetical protein